MGDVPLGVLPSKLLWEKGLDSELDGVVRLLFRLARTPTDVVKLGG